MIDRHSLTVRPIERSYLRVIPAGMVAAFIIGSATFAPYDLDASTRVYLIVVGVLTLLLYGTILTYRHRGLARRAESCSAPRDSGMIVLFERAAFTPSDPSAVPWRLDKGWLLITTAGIEVWDGWGSQPRALLGGHVSVEVIRGDALWRPVARFRFSSHGFVDAAVTRGGLADLRGWSSTEIENLNQILPHESTPRSSS
ncbi:hypothetical protein [Microbacterium sp. SLBN-146]|uniref:hypothetical protein n=1 Tax=Microbacterium sp. SLBN-146 TaxID=2768457 RepID=UPI001153BCCC|nr:hypothetical protein [Microbacterium sp. SLBN-146]TQJ30053.1 hypothetical protein FBY39_0498 [Microbacterium sp. SLBN-146]